MPTMGALGGLRVLLTVIVMKEMKFAHAFLTAANTDAFYGILCVFLGQTQIRQSGSVRMMRSVDVAQIGQVAPVY